MKKMKIQSMVAIGFGCATVALAGQTGPAAQGAANKQTQNTQAGAPEMTIVGCLQRGDQVSGAAGSGSATQSGAAGSFVLANASPQSSTGAGAGRTTGNPDASGGSTTSPSTSAGGTSTAGGSTAAGRTTTGATAGTSGAANSGMTYMLDGGTNLAANVGKRVEVKGTLVSGASAASGSGAAGPGTATSGSASGSATGAGTSGTMATQRLRVTSVREVAGNCTPAASGSGSNR